MRRVHRPTWLRRVELAYNRATAVERRNWVSPRVGQRRNCQKTIPTEKRQPLASGEAIGHGPLKTPRHASPITVGGRRPSRRAILPTASTRSLGLFNRFGFRPGMGTIAVYVHVCPPGFSVACPVFDRAVAAVADGVSNNCPVRGRRFRLVVYEHLGRR